jgi:hypothetical protein
MTYDSRIPTDEEYLHSLGRAFYNFTYLEWIVVWTIVKLSDDGFKSVPSGKPAGEIARALIRAVETTTLQLPSALRSRLIRFHQSYRQAISRRNKLLHAHPYTEESGAQRLGGGGHKWPIDLVDEAARFFEEAAISGNTIFHEELARMRP